ncbi:hypothetical protein ACHHYP_12559 [Achlya hypogyna]|uniref:Uncharacterized protein n=1 Tax=Achlya hypogyna TaxID=1202772 RepID=A0A1V9YGN9_ACHHY|nr:hypothetical protein ACHHYP_12559 [Achlya hypogyna]
MPRAPQTTTPRFEDDVLEDEIDDEMQELDDLIAAINDAVERGAGDDSEADLTTHTQHLNYFLAHRHQDIAARAFLFVEELHGVLGDRMSPVLYDWMLSIGASDIATTDAAILAVATLATYDIHAFHESYQALDAEHPGAADEWLGLVFVKIATKQLLATLSAALFTSFLQLLNMHLDKPSLTSRATIAILEVAKYHPEQFDAWWDACDTETVEYVARHMPTSRAIQARLLARQKPQSSFARSTSLASSLRQSRLDSSLRQSRAGDSKKRGFNQIGRLDLNGSVLSEIAPLDDSLKLCSPRASLFKAKPTTLFPPLQPDEEGSPFDGADSLLPDDAPPSSADFPSRWHRSEAFVASHVKSLLYLLMATSALFAMYGLTTGALLVSQDFAAWQQRKALNQYRASVERSLAEVARVADVVHEWRLRVSDKMAVSRDRDLAAAISAEWKAIEAELVLPNTSS